MVILEARHKADSRDLEARGYLQACARHKADSRDLEAREMIATSIRNFPRGLQSSASAPLSMIKS
eukprot:4325650-Pyramimonas_sp.AAC.1